MAQIVSSKETANKPSLTVREMLAKSVWGEAGIPTGKSAE